MKTKTVIDYTELEKFLKTLTYRKIQDGELTKAHAMNDIEMFYKTDENKSKITLDQVIDYGMPFLVDAIGNDLSICILTKRKHRLPSGRIVKMKFDKTIIFNCENIFGSCLNGYFVIPDRFLHKVTIDPKR